MSGDYQGVSVDPLGHASVRIETQTGAVIYIDPWEEVIESAPRDGDVVFVTHDDFDHYDPEGIGAVATPDATVAVYEAVDTSSLDADTVDLPHDGTITVEGIDVQTVPAFNEPDGEHVDDSGRPFHARGEVIGVVLTLEEAVVFYPSDTDFLAHHESISVDVLIPPIGGHYTMDRYEAAELARSTEAELVVPVHYDTFGSIEADADSFAENLERAGIHVYMSES